MAGTVIRRLLLEVTDEGRVTIDGFGWASVDTPDGEQMLWLGGDLPDFVLCARADQIDAPQAVATEVWQLDRLESLLATTVILAREHAVSDDEEEE